MTNDATIERIKNLLMKDRLYAVTEERKRINSGTLPRLNQLFFGLRLRYKETGETVTVTAIGELFETIQARFPNGTLWWCCPEEFTLLDEEKAEAD